MVPLVEIAGYGRRPYPIQKVRYGSLGQEDAPAILAASKSDPPELAGKGLSSSGRKAVSTKDYLSQVSLIGVKATVAAVPQVGYSWCKNEVVWQDLLATGIPAIEIGQQLVGDVAINLVRNPRSIAVGFGMNRSESESELTKGADYPFYKLQLFAIVSETRQAFDGGVSGPVVQQAIPQEKPVHNFEHKQPPCSLSPIIILESIVQVKSQMGNQQPSIRKFMESRMKVQRLESEPEQAIISPRVPGPLVGVMI
jgi:hypothetical protein